MRPTLHLLLTTFLASTHRVQAWGTLGHTTVALIASSLVAPQTESYLQGVLYNTSSLYMANVATWADSFRYTKAGQFSASLHYIDAEDNPPEKCEVVFKRDCGEKGCIVGAVGNYTTQLLNTSLPAGQRNMAAKFIIHFLGDIHQPLHTENLAIGGNSIRVLFDTKPTNLHHVWDTSIPEKFVGGYGLPFSLAWSQNLTAEVTKGKFKDQTEGWLNGLSIGDRDGMEESALRWAGESNGLVCSSVLKGGVEGVNGTELGGGYYEEAIDIVELQVAKAGVRLAKWMDLVVEKLKIDAESSEVVREGL